jgi:glycerol-3-phosphate cytidylyltransferase
MKIITFGTYDMFHIGHLNILRNCKHFNNTENTLIVGVSSDELNLKKKRSTPIIKTDDRVSIISSCKFVDEVFVEHSLEEKLDYCIKYNADMLIMGDDHIGKFDFLKEHGIDVTYLPRTNDVSTTDIKLKVINDNWRKFINDTE